TRLFPTRDPRGLANSGTAAEATKPGGAGTTIFPVPATSTGAASALGFASSTGGALAADESGGGGCTGAAAGLTSATFSGAGAAAGATPVGEVSNRFRAFVARLGSFSGSVVTAFSRPFRVPREGLQASD